MQRLISVDDLTFVFGETLMEFTLKYRGEELRPGANKKRCVHEQHILRMHFHEQLKRIWEKDNRLHDLPVNDLPKPIFKDHVFDLPRPLKKHNKALFQFMFKHHVRGLGFVPLITAPMEAYCHLNIRIGRPTKPGWIIYAGGDLDNQLKVLFDALSMPRDKNKLSPEDAKSSEKHEHIFCLLADDHLITKLSIEPHELLTPYPNSHHAEIDIDVKIKAITPMVGTIGLL